MISSVPFLELTLLWLMPAPSHLFFDGLRIFKATTVDLFEAIGEDVEGRRYKNPQVPLKTPDA
jgi:hypothetical protein